jgi:guanylate cyclase, other
MQQKQNLGGTGTPFWSKFLFLTFNYSRVFWIGLLTVFAPPPSLLPVAPELLRQTSANTPATDVYSFGIILYEVYSRRDPYEGENPSEVLRLVVDKTVKKRPPAPRHMPDNIKTLMADCVDDDPENRPSFEELDLRVKRMEVKTVDIGAAKPASSVSLFDIFPRHIAEALRDGRSVEPEHKDSVTIFFRCELRRLLLAVH